MKKGLVLPLLMGSFLTTEYSLAEDNFSWSLRQHSRDKNLISKPAQIQFVDSKDKDNSYNIDAAIKRTFAPENSNKEYAVSYEVHKNTLIDEEQDVQSINGLVGGYVTKWGCETDSGITVCPNALQYDASISYQNDSENDKESILLVTELDVLNPKYRIGNWHGEPKHHWYWAPTLGLEYEDFIDADDGAEGEVGRLYGKVEFGYFPFKKEFDSRIQFSMSFSQWEDFAEDDRLDTDDDSHRNRSATLSYQITENNDDDSKKPVISISLEYMNGEDPRNKKLDQEYTSLAIGILF